MMPVFTLRNGLTGGHVLGALLAFFGLMAVANAFFVYYAVGTFNGFEANDAYRRGLAYNERIAAAEDQASRGWTANAKYEVGSGQLSIDLSQPGGVPVAGLTARGRVVRPATDREDRVLELSETQSGSYVAAIRLAPGQWVVFADLYGTAQDGEPLFRVKQRLWVSEIK